MIGAGRRAVGARPAPPPPARPTATSGSAMDRRLRQCGAHRLVVRERQHAASRRSGRSRGPCRRSAARRRGRAGATPARMASARSPISRAPGAPARISARIASGALAARIVVGDDDGVGLGGGDAAHDRPLALVAVAAAAEHAHEPARRERAAAPPAPRPAHRACARSRRRRGRRAPAPTISSRPFTPLSCASAGSTRSAGFAGGDGEARGQQRVVGLVGAEQRQADVDGLAVVAHPQALREAVRRRALAASASRRPCRRSGRCGPRARAAAITSRGMLGIGIDDRGAARAAAAR